MSTFPDVPEGHWAYDDIEWAAARGIYHGRQDGTFDPDAKQDRDESAVVARRIVRLVDPELAEMPEEPDPGPDPDVTAPVIVLLGENPMTVLQGNAFVDPGYVVTDDTDPNPQVMVFGEVDVATPATYQIEYQATDSAGNYSTVIRTVIVQQFQPGPGPEFDVILEPGDNLQQKINQAGESGVVGIGPGLFNGASVNLLPGQHVELVHPDIAAEWNGQGASYGLRGMAVPGVVVRGHKHWILRNYNTPKYRGVIDTFSPGDWYGNPVITDHGWDVDGVIVRDASYGVTLFGHGARLTNFELHNIGTLGFSMRFHDDMYVGQGLLRHIGHNNVHGGWGHEGGGSKSWETRRLVHENIDVADTIGPGLWTDHGNHETVYRNIVAHDCSAAAIFHEISGSSLIEDCEIYDLPGNGDDSVWSRGGQGINIANAQAVIRNCVLRNMETGIGFIDHNRGGWTGTCAGEVSHVTLDNAGRSGAAGNGTEGRVDWDLNSIDLLNGSFIQ